MAKLYDFEQARNDKYVQKSYEAPEEIIIPEFVQEGVANQQASQRRALLKAAVVLIDSGDIPAVRELADDELPPRFDDPSTKEK